MSDDVMSKQELLQAFAGAYERVIAIAAQLERQGSGSPHDVWGAREAPDMSESSGGRYAEPNVWMVHPVP